MFVVKRAFKNLGKTYTAGSVITEPACIKRFKGKLAEGKIIEVTEQTYDNASKYFKDKHGVVIPPITEKQATVDNKEVKPVETKVEHKPTEIKKVVVKTK
jgi:hypothetical protein